jgi:hypothetical protein
MKLRLSVRSLLMFTVSIILLVVLTLAERAMAGMSLGTQRLISLVALVAAPGFGAVLATLSLIRKEGWTWLAVTGLVLNSLFALFHLLIVVFAG